MDRGATKRTFVFGGCYLILGINILNAYCGVALGFLWPKGLRYSNICCIVHPGSKNLVAYATNIFKIGYCIGSVFEVRFSFEASSVLSRTSVFLANRCFEANFSFGSESVLRRISFSIGNIDEVKLRRCICSLGQKSVQSYISWLWPGLAPALL